MVFVIKYIYYRIYSTTKGRNVNSFRITKRFFINFKNFYLLLKRKPTRVYHIRIKNLI